MNVIVMANWGLGLEILKALHEMAYICIKQVITQFNPETRDQW